MSLSISLAKYNDFGLSLYLESDGDDITLYEDINEQDVQAACAAAKASLESVIRRLDLLATADKPFHAATHGRINNA